LQTSDAFGAAAAQLGPDAQAAIVELNKQGGLSHGKVTRCLGSLFGIPHSRGGSVHTVLRAASRCEPVYEAIRETVCQSDWVVPDETGWRVGGYRTPLSPIRQQARNLSGRARSSRSVPCHSPTTGARQ
jgi:transposase